MYVHIFVRIGHEDLFGKKLTEEDLIEILKKYPLHQALDLFSKIDVLLNVTPDPENKMLIKQRDLALDILPKYIIERFLRKKSGSLPAFFTRAQLTYLKKLALKRCPHEDNKENIWKDLQSKEISQLFLGANDRTNQEIFIEDPSVEENVLSFFIKAHYCDRKVDQNVKIPRAYMMFCKLQKPFENKKLATKYKNLDDLFMDKVELTPLDAMKVGFTITAKYLASYEAVAQKTVMIDPKIDFKELNIETEKIEKMLDLLSIDLDELKSELDKEGQISGYDSDIFVKKPLLRLTKDGITKYLCLDAVGLFEKFTTSLNWLLGNNNDLSKPLTNYRGKQFDEYLIYLLEKYCNKRANLDLLYIDDFGKNEEELGDAIIIDRKNKVILVFEAKARQYSKEIKVEGDLEKLTGHFTEIAKQMDAAIKKLKDGALLEKGIDPTGFTFYPILTFYDTIPSDPALQRYFRKKFKEAGYLDQEYIAEAEITSIMSIENAYEIEKDLSEILIEKHRRKDREEAELGGYIAIECKEFGERFLKEETNEFLDEIKTILVKEKNK